MGVIVADGKIVAIGVLSATGRLRQLDLPVLER